LHLIVDNPETDKIDLLFRGLTFNNNVVSLEELQ
jgi:hypothetical protein